MEAFKKKLFLNIGITAGVVIIFTIGILIFGSSISANSEKIISTRKEVSDWNVSVQSYSAVRSQYTGKAKEYSEILEKVIPQKDELINLKKDFQYLASSEKLEMSFAFLGEQGTNAPQLGSVGVSITIQGSMEMVASFLQKLESFRYLMGVESLTFDNREGKSNASLRGRIFFKK
ncbi:MAG: type 4a pilus biogenesis protein PilO [Patescibacteria group bacterium]